MFIAHSNGNVLREDCGARCRLPGVGHSCDWLEDQLCAAVCSLRVALRQSLPSLLLDRSADKAPPLTPSDTISSRPCLSRASPASPMDPVVFPLMISRSAGRIYELVFNRLGIRCLSNHSL